MPFQVADRSLYRLHHQVLMPRLPKSLVATIVDFAGAGCTSVLGIDAQFLDRPASDASLDVTAADADASEEPAVNDAGYDAESGDAQDGGDGEASPPDCDAGGDAIGSMVPRRTWPVGRPHVVRWHKGDPSEPACGNQKGRFAVRPGMMVDMRGGR